MSGHAEDPVVEESKRFFTFFNLSMILVAITGLEIVIIYVQSFDGSTIIGVLFATSIVKFIGVVTWFMHLSCLLYTSPSPRDPSISRMPSSA